MSAPNFIFVPPCTIYHTHLFSTLRHGVLQQVDVNFCHLLWLLSPSFPNFLSPFTQAKKDEQLLKKRNLQVEPDETPLQESNKTVPLDLSLPAIISVSHPLPPLPLCGLCLVAFWSLWSTSGSQCCIWPHPCRSVDVFVCAADVRVCENIFTSSALLKNVIFLSLCFSKCYTVSL